MQTDFFAALLNVIRLVWLRLNHGFVSHSWVTIFLVAAVTLCMFMPDAVNAMKFDSHQILTQGEWWRVVTSPLVHSSWDHYTWNVVVLFASSLVCEQINRRAFIKYLSLMLVTNAAYKLVFLPADHISLGFSGFASGTFVLLLILIICEGMRTRDIWMIAVSGFILLLFSSHELGYFGSHTGWEMLSGRSIDGAPGKKTKPAHIVGMITGCIIGSGYLFAAAIKTKRSKCQQGGE